LGEMAADPRNGDVEECGGFRNGNQAHPD
jgi:hypothetical protein